MTGRLRKSILVISLVTLSLPVLAALAVIIVAGTESGTRWAIGQVVARTPGTLEISEFEGTLWRGIRFPTFSYSDADRQIDGVNLGLQFAWTEILAKRLTIEEIEADSFTYRDLSVTVDEPEPLNVETQLRPVTIVVEEGLVKELIITGPEDVVIERIALDNFWFNGRRIRIATASIATQGIAVVATNASVLLDGKIPIAAALRWQMIDGEWSGTGTVRGTVAEIGFDQFLEAPYTATVSGVFIPAVETGPWINALVNWENWVIEGRNVKDGEVRVRGWLDGYDLRYDGIAQLADEVQLAVSGTATGTSSGLDQIDASLVNALGRIEARGSVFWEPVLQIRADVQIIDADAGALAPGLPGGINGNVHLQYSDDAQLKLDGQLKAADNELRVKGSMSAEQLSIVLGFDVPQLATVVEDVSGVLSGNGTLSGTPSDPVLSLILRGQDIRQASRSAPALDIGLSGTLRRADCGWSSLFDSASISEMATGTWTLTNPIAVQYCEGALSVAAHVWTGDNGDIRVDRIDAGKDTIAVVAGIDRLPLSLADTWLPPDVRLLGTANAKIDLMRSGNQWSGTASWVQSHTVLRVTPPGEPQTDVHIPRAGAEARLEQGALATKVEITIDPGVTGTLDLELAEFSRDSRLSARLLLQGDEWKWVSVVIPQIDQFKGSMSADVAASGTVAAPELAGTLSWNDGSLLLPALNVPLHDINVVVEGGSSGTATLHGSARAGEGSLTFSGKVSELIRPSPVLRVQVQGESAELLDWPEYHLWASPDIVVTRDSGGWRLDGRIEVPRADVVVSQLPEEAVSISPDVVVLGE